MNEIKLTFTVEETNQLLGVLGELPSRIGVFPLILKIMEQAKAQTPQPEPAE